MEVHVIEPTLNEMIFGAKPRTHLLHQAVVMEAKELREMSAEELVQKRASLREEITHLKLKRATSRLENPMKLKETKRDLARIETILREKALRPER